MSSLAEKVAVVTGGSRGIGLAVARLLGQRGVGGDHRTSAAGQGGRPCGPTALALPFAPTVSMDGDGQAASALGGNDIVVNNAGVGIFKPSPRCRPTIFG
jgi:NAD(P)-dependent dehydrogenase (short-subunit alcohol dehydrogenase family)